MMKLKSRTHDKGLITPKSRNSVKERRNRRRIGKRIARPNLTRNGGKLRRVGRLGKRTGVNIKVATMNIRGLGDIGKRLSV